MAGNLVPISVELGITWSWGADTVSWSGTDEEAKTMSHSTGPLVLLTNESGTIGTCFLRPIRLVRLCGRPSILTLARSE